MNPKTQDPKRPYPIMVIIMVGLIVLSCGPTYSQNDYLEVKGNIKTDTVDFDTFTGDTGGKPSTPVRGEVFYDFATSAKVPSYFDGSQWLAFGADGPKAVGTKIVAAYNSLASKESDGSTCEVGDTTCDNPQADYTCDGTDDQTTIQAAIDALGTTGGAVYLLEGTYNISGSINITRNNVALIGAGEETILSVSGAVISVISLGDGGANAYEGILIKHLQINGNSNVNYGIYFNRRISNSIVEKTRIRNCNIYGIYLYGTSGFENLQNMIVNNEINSNGNNTAGIYLGRSSNNSILNNIINNNNRDGVYIVSPSSNNIVSGNHIQSNTRYGIAIMGFSSSIPLGNLISHNDIQGNGPAGGITGCGIQLMVVANNSITNNNIQGNNGRGIVLGWNNVRDNLVTGNNISSNISDGISISSSTNTRNSIVANIFTDNGGDGIDMASGSDTLISSNLFYDSAGTDFPIRINGSNSYLVGNLVSSWPASYANITDSGTGTKYTDKAKITLERATDSNSPIRSDRSYVKLSFSSASATIDAGKSVGDILTIEGPDSGSVTINDGGGNVNLEENHTLQANDILKLIWNGSKWLEIKYAHN